MRFYNLSYQDRQFKNDGKKYDLSHLKPFFIDVKARKGIISVKVVFSTHVFTEKFDETKHELSLRIEDHTDKNPKLFHNRAFNTLRHKRSKVLPNILNTINNRTTIQKTDTNDFIVSDNDYYIFFRIYKLGGKPVLHVKSAYPKKNKLSGAKSTIGKRLVELGF